MSNTNDKIYCVYVHINKVNGKFYIGQTCKKPEYRWRKGEGYKGCAYFYRAIQKYGWDNFEHIILLSNLTLEDANYFETELIRKLDTTNPNKGYNIEFGGKNSSLSEITKQKLRKAMLGKHSGENHPLYGKHHTEETKRKLSESHKGKHPSEETRKKIKESSKGKHLSEETKRKISKAKMGENHPFYGKHHSDETKQKISASLKDEKHPNFGKHWSEEVRKRMSNGHKGKYPSDEARKKMSESKIGTKSYQARKVAQYDKEGNLIKIWDYIKQAEKELGIPATNISKCCRGKYKTAGGFVWRYVDDK
jgi:group I intron endonuclease